MEDTVTAPPPDSNPSSESTNSSSSSSSSTPSSSPPSQSSSPPPPPTATATPPPVSSPSPPPPTTPASSSAKSPPPKSSPSPPPPHTSSSPPPPVSSSSIPSQGSSPPPPYGSSSTVSSPPPPPTSRKSPPSSNTSSSSSGSSSSSSSSSSDSTGLVVVVAVIGVLIIAMLIASCICCLVRKKKRKEYYMDPPPLGPKGDYYNGQTKWNSPSPKDHVMKLPPPPGGGSGWAVPPTPPPGATDTSSEFSSSHHTRLPPSSPNMGLGVNQSSFSYDELAAATGGFSQANLLGQGGFGYVHKGVLSNGKEVAVKSLKVGSGQGEREFQAEVEIISRVHHRHLVSLVGYCIAGGQRMLVYEFVPNNTLEHHLHGQGLPTMDWATRMRIALGSAKGLAYLHEDCHPRIIHRDIKTANILIDNNFEAMVADFGLAKLSSDNFTHVSTRVMGTFGYLAPEYASSGKLTEKSDVFSFGVMLLEIITARQPVDPNSRYMEDSLVDWARPRMEQALEDGNYDELVDPRLENNFVPQEMARMVACASASIRHSARRRPKMSQIVRTLEGNSSLDDLNNATAKPSNQNSAYNSSNEIFNPGLATKGYDTAAYNADMVKFKQMVMSKQEYANSSDFGVTSEYGLNPSSSSDDSREFGLSGNQRHKL
ncbi:Proline-rich receptor-like protein kinase PERK5 [Camellia lanceoleosa]|uniref:Proline-rich receptor-like protein kinase PERK5 n=1 Tax=Camellia lanceoleosa TaxID=1840588 RepID=A0ACC0I699_9ERIC|nr:Proline-rich receptor-like protein kinase PERK5 [Camellia lanceoleosa]